MNFQEMSTLALSGSLNPLSALVTHITSTNKNFLLNFMEAVTIKYLERLAISFSKMPKIESDSQGVSVK